MTKVIPDAVVVLVDMVGSAKMERLMGRSATAALKSEFMRLIVEQSINNNGRMDNFYGDGALVIFEGPTNKIDACYFSSSLLSTIAENNQNEKGKCNAIDLRTGIACGTIESLYNYRFFSGQAINIAGRLSDICKKNQVLVIEPIAEFGKRRGLSFSAGVTLALKDIGNTLVFEFIWDGTERGPSGETISEVERFESIEPTISEPIKFNFEVKTLTERQMIRDMDLPLMIEGVYAPPSAQAHVWVILQDTYGNYYLQNPPVSLLPDGRWIATNVLPGHGIVLFHFVRVGSGGHANFLQMVARRAWGAFKSLPGDSEILNSVQITRI